ncbi:unnamed protein product [Cylicocyclus nassatus]|uniref:Uncharacterized protein n=1 Tax=Cylicocyclus nassatus TaxID=53992 RepID=A0AA36GM67_CYLNA|nr:unnamed protein product [Cylicocyclus nassatus]
MLVLVLTSFILGARATEPCVPYISEISNLTFGNTRDLQFIELQVAESCRTNRKAMQEMIFSDYGLVILHTKSREKGDRLAFEMKTFVKLARSLWPKQRHETNAKRGGRRVADEFLAFFVVSGPAALAPPVTAGDRSGEAINWVMYTSGIGVKCGSLINWPHCEQAMPQGQGSLDRFLVTESPSPISVHISSEKELLQGQTVLQFDSNKNKYFAPELVVTREKQEWLSARIKDIIVLTPSLDESEILSLHRLKYLISPHLPVAIHVLPEGFTALKGDESISRCSSDEDIFAVTKRAPGTDNLCDGNVNYLHRTPITELCEPDVTPEHNTTPEDMILDTEEFYEPYLDILMNVDDVAASTSQQPATPASATPAPTTLIPTAPAHITPAPHQRSCPNLELIRKQDKAIISLNRLLEGEERIQNQVCNVDARVRQIQSNLNEQEELRKAAAEYATLEVRRKFGKEMDPELQDRLRRLRHIGIDFTDAQIKKISHSWLQLVLDDSKSPQELLMALLAVIFRITMTSASAHRQLALFALCAHRKSVIRGIHCMSTILTGGGAQVP